MAASAKANESQHAYITAIADGEKILSSHRVEANTSRCVTEVMSLKDPMKEERAKNATRIHLSTALQDHAHRLFPLVCMAESL